MKTSVRKTLSGVDASQLNARAHQAPSDSTLAKPYMDATFAGKNANRVSQSRTFGKYSAAQQRRHSVYFSTGQAPRVDPRPLSDKAYINSCIRQLISFLTSRGYDAPISPKTLVSPTAKDFASLSLFLFRLADENFKFGSKTEDDVPTVFKQLRYPFQISKSALYAVGSPHTWPSLLTALTWLVQIFVYEEEARHNESKVACNQPSLTFFKYVSCAYGHFLSGDDPKCIEVEREFTSTQQAKYAESSRTLAQIEKENVELEALLASLAKDSPNKTAMQREKEVLMNVVRGHEEDTASMKVCISSAEAASALGQQSVCKYEGRLDFCRKEIAQLRQRVSSQPVGITEAKTIEKDIVKQKEALTLLTTLQSNVETRSGAAESEAEKVLADLEGRVHMYNSLARKLQIVPHTAKYADESNFEAVINSRAQTAEAMINVDVKNTVRATMKKIHDIHIEHKWKSEREYVNLEQNLQSSQETFDEMCDEANQLTAKAKRCGSIYDTERKQVDDMLSGITHSLANIEAEIESQRDASDGGVHESEAALHACQGEYDDCIKQCGQERLAVQNLMLAALDALMGHKQQIQDRLQERVGDDM